MDLRIVISGAGKMGRQIAESVAGAPGMEPVAFLDGLATENTIDGLPVYTDSAFCLEQTTPDVVIDFSNASWTPGLAAACLHARVRLVCGTTGLAPEFMEFIEREARDGVRVAGTDSLACGSCGTGGGKGNGRSGSEIKHTAHRVFDVITQRRLRMDDVSISGDRVTIKRGIERRARIRKFSLSLLHSTLRKPLRA